jgi:mono/diheme cytochrome c family protein
LFWRRLVFGVVAVFGYLGCETPPPDGRSVFMTIGCARCHGNEGGGESLGPPLEDLSAKFSAQQLDQLLDNPIAYVENDERLKKWREEYFTPMPKLQMTDAQRKALVVYLFEKHP